MCGVCACVVCGCMCVVHVLCVGACVMCVGVCTVTREVGVKVLPSFQIDQCWPYNPSLCLPNVSL